VAVQSGTIQVRGSTPQSPKENDNPEWERRARGERRGEATATKAIILIETAAGTSRVVSDSLKGVPGIEAADLVTGPYDVIAVLAAIDMGAIGSLVEQHIHTLRGVTRTVTCVATGE